jgi:hypothetical protein
LVDYWDYKRGCSKLASICTIFSLLVNILKVCLSLHV